MFSQTRFLGGSKKFKRCICRGVVPVEEKAKFYPMLGIRAPSAPQPTRSAL